MPVPSEMNEEMKRVTINVTTKNKKKIKNEFRKKKGRIIRGI
jgi:hypothetical protein